MSFTPAKAITSSQTGLHKNLEKTVRRHLETSFMRPIPDHTKKAFLQTYKFWETSGRPKVVLDSACGTAESSHYFAKINPDKLCIGLDHSEKRLAKCGNKDLAHNLMLMRCDCTDFWRLAEQANWKFYEHYLLYPNPYPKTEHLKRRWHGHPAFSSLLKISKNIELRTNWKIYAEEFCYALRYAKIENLIEAYKPEKPITAFERKYLLSSHELWRSSCSIT